MNPTGSGRFVPSSIGGSPFSAVRFFPFNGNVVTIDGVQHAIPTPGIDGNFLDATIDGVPHQTLAPNTTYYAYAYMDAGVMKMDFSTTGWVTDDGTWQALAGFGIGSGIGIKYGDSSRSVVGLIRTNAQGRALGDDKNQCTSSFYNRVRIGLRCNVVNSILAGSTWPIGWIEPNSLNRVSFVCWQDDIPEASLSGTMTNNTQWGHNEVAMCIDGNVVSSIAVWDAPSANASTPFNVEASSDGGTVEGYHYYGIMMKATPGSQGCLAPGITNFAGSACVLKTSQIPS